MIHQEITLVMSNSTLREAWEKGSKAFKTSKQTKWVLWYQNRPKNNSINECSGRSRGRSTL